MQLSKNVIAKTQDKSMQPKLLKTIEPKIAN